MTHPSQHASDQAAADKPSTSTSTRHGGIFELPTSGNKKLDDLIQNFGLMCMHDGGSLVRGGGGRFKWVERANQRLLHHLASLHGTAAEIRDQALADAAEQLALRGLPEAETLIQAMRAELPAKDVPRTCTACGRTLDVANDLSTLDCGGDCMKCMAEAGDPDCTDSLKVANAATTSEGNPEGQGFHTGDALLDDLLLDTWFMGKGPNNMDTALMWMASLETFLDDQNRKRSKQKS